jgi:hypothetical protein
MPATVKPSFGQGENSEIIAIAPEIAAINKGVSAVILDPSIKVCWLYLLSHWVEFVDAVISLGKLTNPCP